MLRKLLFIGACAVSVLMAEPAVAMEIIEDKAAETYSETCTTQNTFDQIMACKRCGIPAEIQGVKK